MVDLTEWEGGCLVYYLSNKITSVQITNPPHTKNKYTFISFCKILHFEKLSVLWGRLRGSTKWLQSGWGSVQWIHLSPPLSHSLSIYLSWLILAPRLASSRNSTSFFKGAKLGWPVSSLNCRYSNLDLPLDFFVQVHSRTVLKNDSCLIRSTTLSFSTSQLHSSDKVLSSVINDISSLYTWSPLQCVLNIQWKHHRSNCVNCLLTK